MRTGAGALSEVTVPIQIPKVKRRDDAAVHAYDFVVKWLIQHQAMRVLQCLLVHMSSKLFCKRGSSPEQSQMKLGNDFSVQTTEYGTGI